MMLDMEDSVDPVGSSKDGITFRDVPLGERKGKDFVAHVNLLLDMGHPGRR